MSPLTLLPFARTAVLALLACAAGAVRAPAQTDADAPKNPLQALRAEIHVKSLYSPSRPVSAGFILFNASDQPVDVPLDFTPQIGGIGLPLQLITGPADPPRLTIEYEDERPVAVRGSTRSSTKPAPSVLRLAPHGAVGAELDLRDLHRQIRYRGLYRLQWRPLGARIPAATAEFRIEPRQDAIIVTDLGKITFSLMYQKAPKNLENFLELAREKFYDGKTFHRVVPGFLIQGGCPLGNGRGARLDGKSVPAEFHNAEFKEGTLAMAHKPDDPNSASCQFFITFGRVEDLDGEYTIIGQARDEESIRTLRALADIKVDRKDRPLRPIYIRFVTLVDAD
jgi:cyclophilin family peptidyl-prolyl cis-trans isomerase